METKILVLYYSLHGHLHTLANAIEQGINSVDGVKAVLKRVPETLPDNVIEIMGAEEFQKQFKAEIPEAAVDELKDYDAILFGTPTRFGNMCGQMRQFLDATGQLWFNGELIGKPAGVFTSTATQHGGQETTILTFLTNLMHHGMVVTGLPYSFQAQMGIDEVNGLSPYGASTITGGQGQRMPGQTELEGAKFQGKYIAEIAKKLKQ